MIICLSVTEGTGKLDLMVNKQDMDEQQDNKKGTVVEVIESGPLRISGNIVLKDMQRNKEEYLNEVWLCRCGKSEHKPFCDSSHKKA